MGTESFSDLPKVKKAVEASGTHSLSDLASFCPPAAGWLYGIWTLRDRQLDSVAGVTVVITLTLIHQVHPLCDLVI